MWMRLSVRSDASVLINRKTCKQRSLRSRFFFREGRDSGSHGRAVVSWCGASQDWESGVKRLLVPGVAVTRTIILYAGLAHILRDKGQLGGHLVRYCPGVQDKGLSKSAVLLVL